MSRSHPVRVAIARAKRWGIVLGPLLGALAFVLLPDGYVDASGQTVALDAAARTTAALGVWMAVWWLSEAIPIYATALLPLAVLPLGGLPVGDVASPYGHPLIFLFMGGFLLALAMQRCGLDRRIALTTLSYVGTRPRGIVAGFMFVTAMLSMWVSNTATAVMMLPVAASVITLAEDRERHPKFAVCLMLAIAYAASIGGVGTLIGTPPNLFLASYVESQLGREISFARWMGVGLPLVAVFLPATWWLLTHVLHPLSRQPLEGVRERVARARAELGRFDRAESVVASVFCVTAAAWVTRPLLVRWQVGGVKPFSGLTDTGIAIFAALVLFALPLSWKKRQHALDWETALHLPWGILVLFGGGLSLADAIESVGLGGYIGSQVTGLAGIPTVLLIASVVALVIFLTELTSNTATTATLIPILAGLAPSLGVEAIALIAPAAIAASCAFMLPVATPPNAVVFGSGRVTLPQMARAGIWLNLLGIALITALTYAAILPLLS